MFKRRNPLSLGTRLLNFLWPSIGWRRAGAYSLHRLARIPGSAYSIAGGFACGAAISFTPFVGLHFILSAILAWIIRANILASAIGTAVGNPWTFPFIWTWLYQTGNWMISGKALEGNKTPKFSEVFGHMMEAMLSLDIGYLVETAVPVFWPMLVSSVPTGFVIWWVFYLPLKYVVQRYQDRRMEKLNGIDASREPLE
ncbi:MAG: DUF2062 domain-containing protein [Rhodospirillales bacterium]|nr:DUF2062 domain-containing protein [Alphaproteobacteria bacterium]MBL6947774.1 DUF2062 domain-containing protein [Rhodospirillales bacterium]